MNLQLQTQKIKELRLRAAPISYSSVEIRAEDKDSLDDRVVKGYMFVWGVPDMHRTKFPKGCCTKSIREKGPDSNAKYKITFLWQHRQDDPLSLFAVLKEDDYGLYFETKPLDDVDSADRAIRQIRSGTLNQFSGGFDIVYDKVEYDETDDSLLCKEIDLFEGSVVTIASQKESYAVRSKEGLEKLIWETEEFIGTLPRKNQFEARQLFARHKSLVDLEPLIQEMALQQGEPTKKGIPYNYLIQNL